MTAEQQTFPWVLPTRWRQKKLWNEITPQSPYVYSHVYPCDVTTARCVNMARVCLSQVSVLSIESVAYDTEGSLRQSKIFTCTNHILRSLLPWPTAQNYSFGNRPHNSQLPDRIYRITNCNFTVRMLYRNMYWHTNKISSKQPKSYLLLTFRPLSEAFIRRSWY